MSEGVITTLISSGFLLIGTVLTVLLSGKSVRTKTAQKIDDVDAKLDAHIKEDEWATAKQCRIRILRFNDEVCAGMAFSENHFEEVLDDIDWYEAFCTRHTDYHNNKGKMAMDNIKEQYQLHKKNNDFLKGGK